MRGFLPLLVGVRTWREKWGDFLLMVLSVKWNNSSSILKPSLFCADEITNTDRKHLKNLFEQILDTITEEESSSQYSFFSRTK